MRLKFQGVYPSEWRLIARRIKEKAGNHCERCDHFHNPEGGYTLTVHHLDNNKANVEDWNLAALCQRCHLEIQGRVNLFQGYMFEHSDWFKPHLEGFLESMRRPN